MTIEPNNLTKFSLALVLGFFFLTLYSILLTPNVAQAEPCEPGSTIMQIPIPGVGEPCQFKGKDVRAVSGLREYIAQFFNWTVGIISLAAVVMIMIGGLAWLLAGGNPDLIRQAKGMIGSSLSALLIVLISFTLFQALNPDIVNLALIKPGKMTGEVNIVGVGGTAFNDLPPVGPGALPQLVHLCKDAPAGSTVAYVNNEGKTKQIKMPVRNDPTYDNVAKLFRCGDSTAVIKDSKGKDIACVGLTCKANGICLNTIGHLARRNEFKCSQPNSVVGGQIAWKGNNHLTNLAIFSVAYKNGRRTKAFKEKLKMNNKSLFYEFSADSDIKDALKESIFGFFIVIKVQNKSFVLDRNCNLLFEIPDSGHETNRIGLIKDRNERRAARAEFWQERAARLIQLEDFLLDAGGGFTSGNIKTYACNIEIDSSGFPTRG